MHPAIDERIVEEALSKAKNWQDRANALLQPEEKRRYRRLARLVANADDKVILTALIDQRFPSRDERRVADQMCHLLSSHGTPRFFSLAGRFHLLGQSAAENIPGRGGVGLRRGPSWHGSKGLGARADGGDRQGRACHPRNPGSIRQPAADSRIPARMPDRARR